MVELACGKLDEVNRGGKAVLPWPLSPGLRELQSETFSVSEALLFGHQFSSKCGGARRRCSSSTAVVWKT